MSHCSMIATCVLTMQLGGHLQCGYPNVVVKIMKAADSLLLYVSCVHQLGTNSCELWAVCLLSL